MKTTRTYTARTADIASTWEQAIRGDNHARKELLTRIMPGKRGR